jgi:hypothetical protein
MGGMSASDAAPLPRLGEVFFDVRGNSRSMRLSWYADTGVAVLSIWQGGMCTGTFRLAIADLPRMVETLQRGPGRPRPEWGSEAPGQTFAQVPRVATGQVEVMNPLPGRAGAEAGYPTGPAQYETHYLPEAPAGRRAGTGELPGPPMGPDYPAQAPHRPSVPAASAAGPPSHRRSAPPAPGMVPPSQWSVPPAAGPEPASPRSVPPDYLAELPDDPGTEAPYPGAPPEYLPAPPDHRARPPGHAAGPPDQLAGPADYPARAPDHRTGYLMDLPGAGPAGYDGLPDAGRHSGAWNPGPGAAAPYPRDSGREAGYPGPVAGDPYLGGTGPVEYQGPQYPSGASASGLGDVPGPDAADYPAQFGDAVTGDIPAGPAPVPDPYDRPPGRHGAAGRSAAPDVPLG